MLSSEDVGKVAELAVEPSYISEIARKLQETDPVFGDFSLTTIIQIVSRSVFVLGEEERVEIVRPTLRGNTISSPKSSLTGEGFSVTDEWKEYTIVQTIEKPDEIREGFRGVVDESITINDKIEITQFLSSAGKQMAELSEDILEDVVNERFDFDHVTTADFNSPGEDVYAEVDGHGYLFEISVRWVNEISTPYINNKFNLVSNFEMDRGVPVDLVIMAPRFSRRAIDRVEDDDIVEIHELPEEGSGNPVITTEAEHRTVFQNDLDGVFREFNVVSEDDYADQIEQIVTDSIR